MESFYCYLPASYILSLLSNPMIDYDVTRFNNGVNRSCFTINKCSVCSTNKNFQLGSENGIIFTEANKNFI